MQHLVPEAAPQGDGAPELTLSVFSSPHGVVTPEMRRAGAEILMTYRGVLDSECLAAEVYNAMAALSER